MKGDVARCRWVLREFRGASQREVGELYAPTPNPITTNLLDVVALSRGWCIQTIDLTLAFPHAEEPDVVYSSVPEGYEREGFVAVRMLRKINGRRDGTHGFVEWFSHVLEDLGFTRCKLNAAVFLWRTGTNTDGELEAGLEMHVDDGHIIGPEPIVDNLLTLIESKVLLKRGTRLTAQSTGAEVQTFLSRERRRDGNTLHRRPCEKFIERISDVIGVTGCTPVDVPGVPAKTGKLNKTDADDEELLDADRHSRFRTAMGIFQYIAGDRVESLYAHKCLSRQLQAPTVGDWKRLKHLARFLENTKDMHIHCTASGHDDTLQVFTDADWAKDRATRKSVDMSCIIWHGSLIFASVSTQSVQALSSGEAEFNGIHRGALLGVYVSNVLAEWGIHVHPQILNDSSAALAMAQRLGVGAVRHMSLRQAFLQEIVRRKRISLKKCAGVDNPADVGTKHLPKEDMMKCLRTLNISRWKHFTTSCSVFARCCSSKSKRFGASWALHAAMLAGLTHQVSGTPPKDDTVIVNCSLAPWLILAGVLIFMIGFVTGMRYKAMFIGIIRGLETEQSDISETTLVNQDGIMIEDMVTQSSIPGEGQRASGQQAPTRRRSVGASTCPICNGPVVYRTNRTTGGGFYGCLSFPACRGTLPLSVGAQLDEEH